MPRSKARQLENQVRAAFRAAGDPHSIQQSNQRVLDQALSNSEINRRTHTRLSKLNDQLMEKEGGTFARQSSSIENGQDLSALADFYGTYDGPDS